MALLGREEVHAAERAARPPAATRSGVEVALARRPLFGTNISEQAVGERRGPAVDATLAETVQMMPPSDSIQSLGVRRRHAPK